MVFAVTKRHESTVFFPIIQILVQNISGNANISKTSVFFENLRKVHASFSDLRFICIYMLQVKQTQDIFSCQSEKPPEWGDSQTSLGIT